MCVSALAVSAAARPSARPCTAASCRGRKPRSYWDGPTRSGGRRSSSSSRACWRAPNAIRAAPERAGGRPTRFEQLQSVLEGAQRDRPLLVYVDEAHIPQEADLGYGWAER